VVQVLLGDDPESTEADWLNHVQLAQDTGSPWARAVEQADAEVAL
jgi:hypothetical protein